MYLMFSPNSIRSASRLSIRWLRIFFDHPVCAAKEPEHFLDGAATPPNLGGEFGGRLSSLRGLLAIGMMVLLSAVALATEHRGQVKLGNVPVPGAVVTASQNGKKVSAIT